MPRSVEMREVDDRDHARLLAKVALYVLENPEEFGDFQFDFATTMAEKLNKYGPQTRFTVAQWDCIDRLCDDVKKLDPTIDVD